MKHFLHLLWLVLIQTNATLAQISKNDMCQFSVKLYERRLSNYGYGNPDFPTTVKMSIGNYRYIGARAMSQYFMEQTYPSLNLEQLSRKFKTLCDNSVDFEKYIYQILLECEGNKEKFEYIATIFCGSQALAKRFYINLASKYAKKIKADIQKNNAKDNLIDVKEKQDQIEDSFTKNGTYLLENSGPNDSLNYLHIYFIDSNLFKFKIKTEDEICSDSLSGSCKLGINGIAVFKDSSHKLTFKFSSTLIEIADKGSNVGYYETCSFKGNYTKSK